MSWFYVDKEGITQGGFDVKVMQQKFASKVIDEESYVWNGTSVNQWTPLKEVGELMNQLKCVKGKIDWSILNDTTSIQSINNEIKSVEQQIKALESKLEALKERKNKITNKSMILKSNQDRYLDWTSSDLAQWLNYKLKQDLGKQSSFNFTSNKIDQMIVQERKRFHNATKFEGKHLRSFDRLCIQLITNKDAKFCSKVMEMIDLLTKK